MAAVTWRWILFAFVSACNGRRRLEEEAGKETCERGDEIKVRVVPCVSKEIEKRERQAVVFGERVRQEGKNVLEGESDTELH